MLRFFEGGFDYTEVPVVEGLKAPDKYEEIILFVHGSKPLAVVELKRVYPDLKS